MPGKKAPATISVTALLTSGCSTIATVIASHSPERVPADLACFPRVYSGVCASVQRLRGDAAEKELYVLDLPFSLVADTLVLPYTLVGQILFGNICPLGKAPPEGSEVEERQASHVHP